MPLTLASAARAVELGACELLFLVTFTYREPGAPVHDVMRGTLGSAARENDAVVPRMPSQTTRYPGFLWTAVTGPSSRSLGFLVATSRRSGGTAFQDLERSHDSGGAWLIARL